MQLGKESCHFSGDKQAIACNTNFDVLPNLGLVSDSPILKEGYGLSRTLGNIFSSYPEDRISTLTPYENLINLDPYGKSFNFYNQPIPLIRNKLGKSINGPIEWINNSLVSRRVERWQDDLDILLICGSYLTTLLVGYKEAKRLQIPYILYLMDDLRALEEKTWFFNNGRRFVKKLLQDAAGWMMISDQLISTYCKRLELETKPALIVHNPVPKSAFLRTSYPIREGLSIAYAGSIWGMHLDALIKFSEAVKQVNQRVGNVSLTIYTTQQGWEISRNRLENIAVRYGGELAYSDLHGKLSEHNLLLVASSFADEYQHLTSSSVQTKLTDYMASARAIISYGPSDSACHSFVERWKCGYISSEINHEKLVEFILSLCNNHEKHAQIGQLSFNNAYDNFTSEIVSPRVFNFIKDLSLKCGRLK